MTMASNASLSATLTPLAQICRCSLPDEINASAHRALVGRPGPLLPPCRRLVVGQRSHDRPVHYRHARLHRLEGSVPGRVAHLHVHDAVDFTVKTIEHDFERRPGAGDPAM